MIEAIVTATLIACLPMKGDRYATPPRTQQICFATWKICTQNYKKMKDIKSCVRRAEHTTIRTNFGVAPLITIKGK